MRRLLSGVAESIRLLGWHNGTLYLASRALDAASRRRCRLLKYYFFAQPVASKAAGGARASERLRIARIEPTDPVVAKFPRPPAVIARRFAGGAVCFVARRDDDEFVGFLWLQHGAYVEDEVRCLFVPGPERQAVWDFDVHVEPAFRMGRAFGRLWDAANVHLREQGVRWSMSRISAFNPPSVRAHERMGSTRMGAGIFLVLGAWQLATFSRSPFVHLSLRERSVPVVRLDGR